MAEEIHTDMTLVEFRDHLDECIRKFRRERDQAAEKDHQSERLSSSCYVDAYQSMRTSLFGELLP